MRRFLGYYRQFEELSPQEVSRVFKQRRDEERAQALTETPPLDLNAPAWHEPPHAEIVNAATFALRRAVNAYPDAGTDALAAALAARHGVEPARIVPGHGAGITVALAVTFFGMIATLMVTLGIATRLDRVWRILRRAAGHEQQEGILPRIFAVTAIVALVLFSLWFWIIEGPAPTLAPR